MANNAQEIPRVSLAEILANIPPQTPAIAVKAVERNGAILSMDLPVVSLWCDSDHCGGIRTHDPGKKDHTMYPGATTRIFADYRCRHCLRCNKVYAVEFTHIKETADLGVLKFGENPPFGPPTPPKLLRLLDQEKDYYLKGRRAESQGMGVAAFAYYRRVVENRKDALLDELIRVSRHLGAPSEMIASLESAKEENSFEKSVNAIKDGIPQSLLLRGGHNPMKLLHTALSEGLHNEDDADCLLLAGDIRAVLSDFVARSSAAMEETRELNDAVSRLLARRSARTQQPNDNREPAP